jgi:hypothetical protein
MWLGGVLLLITLETLMVLSDTPPGLKTNGF